MPFDTPPQICISIACEAVSYAQIKCRYRLAFIFPFSVSFNLTCVVTGSFPTCIIYSDTERALEEIDILHGADFGVSQDISKAPNEGERTMANIAEAREYLAGVSLPEDLKELCRNEHAQCSFWATLGECDGTLCHRTFRSFPNRLLSAVPNVFCHFRLLQ